MVTLLPALDAQSDLHVHVGNNSVLYIAYTHSSLDQVASYHSNLWSMSKARRSASFHSSSQPKGSSGSNLMLLAMADQSSTSPVVTISDVSQLLPLRYDLAQMYRWDVNWCMTFCNHPLSLSLSQSVRLRYS